MVLLPHTHPRNIREPHYLLLLRGLSLEENHYPLGSTSDLLADKYAALIVQEG